MGRTPVAPAPSFSRPADSGRLDAVGGVTTGAALGEDATLHHLLEVVADQLVLGGRHGVVPLAAGADDELLHAGQNSLHAGRQCHRTSSALEGAHDELAAVQTLGADGLADAALLTRGSGRRGGLALGALGGLHCLRGLDDLVLAARLATTLAGSRLGGEPRSNRHAAGQLTEGELDIADLDGGVVRVDTGDDGEDGESVVELIDLHSELPFLGGVLCCPPGGNAPVRVATLYLKTDRLQGPRIENSGIL